jgi:hypothetical protein
MTTPSDAAKPPGRAFLDGLLTPSGSSVVICMLTAFLSVSFLFVIVDAHFFLRHAKEWQTSREDIDVPISAGLLEAHVSPSRPTLFVAGTSTTRAGFDWDAFQSELSRSSRPLQVVNVAQLHQTMDVLEDLSHYLPDQTESVFLIGLAPERLLMEPEPDDERSSKVRLALRGYEDSALRLEHTTQGNKSTGNYMWDNRGFLLPRLPDFARALASGKLSDGPAPGHKKGGPRGPNGVPQRVAAIENPARWEVYARDLAHLQNAVATARQHGLEVIFFIEVVDADFLKQLGLWPWYEEAMARLVPDLRKMGPVIEPGVALKTQDFWDHVHLKSPDAKKAVTAAVAKQLEEIRIHEHEGLQ